MKGTNEQRQAGVAISALKWTDAPIKTQWGEGMKVCDLAIGEDATATIYVHRDGIAQFERLYPGLSSPAGGHDVDATSKDQYRRMFHAACAALGSINEELGLDPNDGGANPIIAAIEDLRRKRDSK